MQHHQRPVGLHVLNFLFTLSRYAMKTFLLLSLAAALLAGCKKENADPDGLVPATQEGKNTGDFLLNGQRWGPQNSPTGTNNPVGANWYGRRLGMELFFYRYRTATDDSGLNFFLPINNIGTFRLTDAVNPNVLPGSGVKFGIYTMYHPSPKRQFLTGPVSIGTVTITRFDTIAHIVSGTFEAKLREYQGPDSLSITKGRFDCTF